MKNINKYIFFILFILISFLIIIKLYNYFKDKEFTKTINYLDTDIVITIKTNTKKANKIFNKIEKIYSKYEKLIDNRNSYDNLNNLYTINYNFNKEDYIELDSDLYDLIEYGISIYDKTNGYIDISNGNIQKLWDEYLITKVGKPDDLVLSLGNNQSINDIILLDKNRIKNNHININLDYIVKGYILGIINKLLKENNIQNYSINDQNNIILGKKKDNYYIAIPDPDNKKNTLKILKKQNVSISITDYKNNYLINENNIYHNLINKDTNKPSNLFKSVIVISDNIKDAEMISKTLFFMSYEDGKKWLKDKNYIDIYWYTLDNKLIK